MKRGTCENGLSVREVVVRESLLDELRRRLTREDGLRRARQRIAQRLGVMRRERGAKRAAIQTRMEKAQAQIGRNIDAIADGEASGLSVKDRVKLLEAQVAHDRRPLEALDRRVVTPMELPTPDKVIAIVFEMDRRLRADPTRGREELRQYFEDGRIDLVPQPGGFYIARSKLLPLVPPMQPPSVANREGGHSRTRFRVFQRVVARGRYAHWSTWFSRRFRGRSSREGRGSTFHPPLRAPTA